MSPPAQPSPKRHLDRFTRFRTTHSCAQHTDHDTSDVVLQVPGGPKMCKGSVCLMYFSSSAFYLRDAMLARYLPSSCLSVRLSVRSRCSTKTAIPRITQTTPYDSPQTVFDAKKSRRNSKKVTPTGGAKQKWGRLQAAIFDQYLAISQKRCKIGT